MHAIVSAPDFADWVQVSSLSPSDTIIYENMRWTGKSSKAGHDLTSGDAREFFTHTDWALKNRAGLIKVRHKANTGIALTLKKVSLIPDFANLRSKQQAVALFKTAFVRCWDVCRGGAGATREASKAAIGQAYEEAYSQLRRSKVGAEIGIYRFKQPSLSSAFSWRKKLVDAEGSLRAVVDGRTIRSGNWREGLSKAGRTFVEMVMARKLVEDAPTISSVYSDEKRKWDADPDRAGLPAPSLSSVYKAYSKLSHALRDYVRYGLEYLEKQYHATGAGLDAMRPGMLLQLDTMLFDVFVIMANVPDFQKLNRQQIRALQKERIVVAAVIDVVSRAIPGFAFGLNEDTRVVQKAARMAFSDKSELAKEAGCKSPYPMYASAGARFVTDHGPAHLEEFTAGLLNSGATHQKAPVGIPWLRAYIERFFRTLALQFFTYFSSRIFGPAENRRKDKRNTASIFLQDIPMAFTRWVVDVYHRRAHRTLGVSPFFMWVYMCEQAPPPPPMAEDELSAVFGRQFDVGLSPVGIQVNGCIYNDQELQRLYAYMGPPDQAYGSQKKAEITIRVDEDNIGYISVRLPAEYARQRRGINEVETADRHWIQVRCVYGLDGYSIRTVTEADWALTSLYGAQAETSLDIVTAGHAFLHDFSANEKLRNLYVPETDPEKYHLHRDLIHSGLRKLEETMAPPTLEVARQSYATGALAHRLDQAQGFHQPAGPTPKPTAKSANSGATKSQANKPQRQPVSKPGEVSVSIRRRP